MATCLWINAFLPNELTGPSRVKHGLEVLDVRRRLARNSVQLFALRHIRSSISRDVSQSLPTTLRVQLDCLASIFYCLCSAMREVQPGRAVVRKERFLGVLTAQ
jgi:hypothetical protein